MQDYGAYLSLWTMQLPLKASTFKETSVSDTATSLQSLHTLSSRISGLICNVIVVKLLCVMHLIITYKFLSLRKVSVLLVYSSKNTRVY